MCDLIAFAIGYFLSVIFYYSVTAPVRITVIFIAIIFFLFLKNEKNGYVLFFIPGLILALMSCVVYDYRDLKIHVSKGNEYISCTYKGKKGTDDIFMADGRMISVKSDFSVEFQKGRTYFCEFKGETRHQDTDGIVFVLSPDAGITESGKDSLRERIEVFKDNIASENLRIFNEETGSVINSLVLGIKDRNIREKGNILRTLGIIHILSISGFHINLLEMFLDRLKMRKLSVPVLVIYGLIIDSVPCMRAVFMKLLKGAAWIMRKEDDIFLNLIISAVIQLFLRPYLISDLSFLLTYSATAGMILFGKKASLLVSKIPLFTKNLTEGVSSSLAALSLSYPFLNLLSDSVSLALIPANMLIVPLYSVFATLSFIAVPLRNTEFAKFLSHILDLILKLASAAEGIILTGSSGALNLKYMEVIVWCIFSVIVINIVKSIYEDYEYKITLRSRIRYFITAVTFLHFIYMNPFVSYAGYIENMGICGISIEYMMEKRTYVNVRMFRPSMRENHTPVVWERTFGGFTLNPSESNYPDLSYKGKILKKAPSDKSDIINSEYILVFGRVIRIR